MTDRIILAGDEGQTLATQEMVNKCQVVATRNETYELFLLYEGNAVNESS